MKGDAKVIEHLNKVLGNELVAINQYFLHSRMFNDFGLDKLGAKEYHESIDEMKHADQLIERTFSRRASESSGPWEADDWRAHQRNA